MKNSIKAERLRAVAAAILNERKSSLPKFNMARFAIEEGEDIYNSNDLPPNGISCNSVCCIAGMACYLYKDEVSQLVEGFDYETEAARILGLSDSEVGIFYGSFSHDDLRSITAEEAAAELYRLADEAEFAELG